MLEIVYVLAMCFACLITFIALRCVLISLSETPEGREVFKDFWLAIRKVFFLKKHKEGE